MMFGLQRGTAGARRLTVVLILSGLAMWIASALFITWAFSIVPASDDPVLMHREKLDAIIGMGLAVFGALFVSFAALIEIIGRYDTKRTRVER